MGQPIIGITCSQKLSSHQRSKGYLYDEYAVAVSLAGGMPLLIPVSFPLKDLPDLLSRLDGILLSGGGDIAPGLSGNENDEYSSNICVSRDTLEQKIVEIAVTRDLPLLGICRGHQMLNVALGGSLYTDIDAQYPTQIRHSQSASRSPAYPAHEVNIAADSLLASILGQPTLTVNSRHHQAVKQLAPGLLVTAQASDGLIEAIEFAGKRFCLGVQWHPESLQSSEAQRRIFEAFITTARRKSQEAV